MVMSQTAQVKQASDACPSWNKKQISTTTEYAYLSKRSAAKDNSDFSKPKYQSIYSRRNGNTPVLKKEQTADALQNPNNESKRQASFAPKEEKNKSSKSIREAGIKKGEKPETDETEEAPAKEEKVETVKEKTEPVKAKGKDVSFKQENKTIASTNKNTNVKYQKGHWLKKIGFRKKNAASCPSF